MVAEVRSSDNAIAEALRAIVAGLEGSQEVASTTYSSETSSISSLVLQDAPIIIQSTPTSVSSLYASENILSSIDQLKKPSNFKDSLVTSKKETATPIADNTSKKAFFQDKEGHFYKYFDAENLLKDDFKYSLEAELPKRNFHTDVNNGVNLFVIGCGGTGSRLVNFLAQWAANSHLSHPPRIILCDFDNLEYKNLSRQAFYEFEVGENKAIALANRYSMLYGIDIVPYTKEITSSDKINRLKDATNYLCKYDFSIVFDCTDNVKARKAIDTLFHSNNYVLISSGNEKDFGQVVIGSNKVSSGYFNFNSSYLFPNNKIFSSLLNLKIGLDAINNIYYPGNMQYFSDMVDSGEVSCGEMEIAEEQSIAINSTMAQVMFNVFFSLVNRNGNLKSSIVWANLENEYSQFKTNTYGGLLKYYAHCIYGRNLMGDKLIVVMKVLDKIHCLLNNEINYVSPSKFFNTYTQAEIRISFLKMLDEFKSKEYAWAIKPYVNILLSFFLDVNSFSKIATQMPYNSHGAIIGLQNEINNRFGA